jgi:hypothetical protein
MKERAQFNCRKKVLLQNGILKWQKLKKMGVHSTQIQKELAKLTDF